MEFQGRIAKVLPVRSGTSQRGEWKSLHFVFEYFENPTDRYADSVLLETFDDKVIDHMKEGMEVRCGFSHRAKEIKRQDGTMVTINEIRLYKIESIKKGQPEPPAQPEQLTLEQQAAMEGLNKLGEQAATGDQNGSKDDDMPF